MFCFSNSAAQSINVVEINGNSDFSKSDYISWIRPQNLKYDDSTLDSIKSRVAHELTKNGYYNFNFGDITYEITADSQYVNYSATLDEGDPTYINDIIISNLDSLELEMANEKFENMKSSPFIIDELETSFSELLDHFENSGYPFASIKIESTFFFYDSTGEEYLVDLYINFSKNQTSTIDTIIISGNTKTKDQVIKRNLRLRKGESYSQEKIDKISIKLNRLHFFEPIETPRYYFNSKDKPS